MSSERGLVYVGRVDKIVPIDGAERIESLEVVCGPGGRWRGCAQKGQFAIGDLCEVYLQDALLPPDDRFAFMAKHGHRVKMARFLGVPSECLIMPISSGVEMCLVGTDIAYLVGVTKYDKPVPENMTGKIMGQFPPFIPKTDEPNFQAVPHIVMDMAGWECVATQKMDGTSTTVYKWEGEFGVCSRNYRLAESQSNAAWAIVNRLNLRENLPDGLALQWETVGPGIQKNPMGLERVEARLFNVWDIENSAYLDRDLVVYYGKELGIPVAPEVWRGTFAWEGSHDFFLKLAEGTYQSGRQQEGVVVRPVEEARLGNDRLSFKVINLLYKEK